MTFDISITCPPPKRRYRGQRARRQAFYSRQRFVRLINAMLRQDKIDWRDAIDDYLKTGTAWIKVAPDGTAKLVESSTVFFS